MGYVPAKLVLEDGQEIAVMFNPSQYDISKNITYSKLNAVGSNNPKGQFISTGTDILKLSLIFNTYNFKDKEGNIIPPVDKETNLDVNLRIKKIYDLTMINPSDHKPPVVTFKWTSLIFKGFITSISRKYTMFLDDGTPVRATVDITMQNGDVTQNQMLESPDRTKYRIINEGTELWEQANNEYNDPSRWREIARANNISDPLDIKSGDNICIPPL